MLADDGMMLEHIADCLTMPLSISIPDKLSDPDDKSIAFKQFDGVNISFISLVTIFHIPTRVLPLQQSRDQTASAISFSIFFVL